MNQARLALACLFCCALPAQGRYKTPPQAITDAIDAPPPPLVRVAPGGRHLLLIARQAMPSIATQARPILRLAGLRIDPKTHGPQRGARRTGFSIRSVEHAGTRVLKVPARADLGMPLWTADGDRFAFTNTTDEGIELWIADVVTGLVRRVPGVRLVATIGRPIQWMPDQRTLLCQVRADQGAPPARATVPSGPVVQETSGHSAPVRTYEDLLQDSYDAELFEYYMTAQLALVDPSTDTVTPVGAPEIPSRVSPSPDGRFLLVERLRRPFSFLVTHRSFPREIVVWDTDGTIVTRIARPGLAENVPIGGVRKGPRQVGWIPTADATLIWTEALDGGDPRAKVRHRDRISVQAAPFEDEPVPWFETEFRFAGAAFGERGDLALLGERDRRKRLGRMWKADPRALEKPPVLLFEHALQDAYGDPGQPVMRLSRRGRRVVREHADTIFLSGRGASPKGDRPFLDRWDLATGKKKRLFRCREERYETLAAMLADDGSRILVRSESPAELANYHVLDVRRARWRRVTSFADPLAEITRKLHGKLIKYQRKDGVPLSGTLYLPPDHQDGHKLPVLVWAYPREYSSAKNAGQVRGSPYRHARLSGTSPLLLTLTGYAVFNGAAMPIIGPTRTANDSFVEQLVADGAAAVDKLSALGVADPDRIAIAGHSYGAFMAANLLAHSNLFRAGIARSGAYNRSLTPFGFQNERRTFWEAPKVYFAMSPFMHAEKIDEPLLLIHGMADNNSGTFPIQSRRLYHAIKGLGGKARLVMLPLESHGYRARESVLDCMAEMTAWLDRFVKNASPRDASGAAEAAAGKRGS